MPNPAIGVQDSSTGRLTPVKGTDGAAHVTQKDANDNTIGGAFAPSDQGADLNIATIQVQELGAGTYYVHFCSTSACRVKFGTSSSVTVTASTGTRIPANTPVVFAVPAVSGVASTHFAAITESGACTLNWTAS